MDAVTLAVYPAQTRGFDHLDDILDAVLTHIAGTLYAVGDVTRQMLVHDMWIIWSLRRSCWLQHSH